MTSILLPSPFFSACCLTITAALARAIKRNSVSPDSMLMQVICRWKNLGRRQGYQAVAQASLSTCNACLQVGWHGLLYHHVTLFLITQLQVRAAILFSLHWMLRLLTMQLTHTAKVATMLVCSCLKCCTALRILPDVRILSAARSSCSAVKA